MGQNCRWFESDHAYQIPQRIRRLGRDLTQTLLGDLVRAGNVTVRHTHGKRLLTCPSAEFAKSSLQGSGRETGPQDLIVRLHGTMALANAGESVDLAWILALRSDRRMSADGVATFLGQQALL